MQTVTFVGVPSSRDVYLDILAGNAVDVLAILEAAPWAKRVEGTVAKVRAAGTPHSVNINVYTKKGVRITIASGAE